MKLFVRYFASVREKAGVSEEWIEVPNTLKTAGSVRDFLISEGGARGKALSETSGLRIACRLKMANPDTPVSENDEIAFFPPVTGG